MKDTRYGKTVKGNEVVYYYLSDAKDLFRLVDKLTKNLHVNLFVSSQNSIRYKKGYKGEDNSVLLTMILAEENRGEIKETDVKNAISAGEVDDYFEEFLGDLPKFELENGLYAVDVTDIIDNDEKAYKIYEKLFNENADFYLEMGGSINKFSWKPTVLGEKYIIRPAVSNVSADEPDFIQNGEDKIVFI